MKPVLQTQFGKPLGNCWAAAIASILEVELTDIPQPVTSWPKTWNAVLDWLADRGLTIFSATVDLDHPDFAWPKGIYIVNGKASRGLKHSVVYKDGVMIHDPYPVGGGLTKPDEIELIHSLDPAICGSDDAEEAKRFDDAMQRSFEGPEGDDAYVLGMRAYSPAICWKKIDGGIRACIRDRGHDDGVHQ